MKLKKVLRSLILAAGLLGFVSLLYAETRVTQEAELGFQQKDVNSSEAKFEEYGEVPNGTVLEYYGITTQGENLDFEFNLNKLRLDNQSADFSIEGSKFGVEGSWDQIPHLYSNDARTLYMDDGNGTLSLSDGIQGSLQSVGESTTSFITNYSSFATGAHFQELKTQTNKGQLGFDYRFSDRLKANISAAETIKKGYQAKGLVIDRRGTSGSASRDQILVELPREVDFKTYDSNVGLGFASDQMQWGLNYNFSSFKNDLDALTADNPNIRNGSASLASTARISLEPDNYSHSMGFDGGLDLPVHSRFTIKSSFNYMRQNQGPLPYTSNPYLTTDTMPMDDISAKAINWVNDLNLVSKPIKSVDVGVRYHSDQFQNKTQSYSFPGIQELEDFWTSTDTVNENHNYSYRKDSLVGKAGWQVFNPLNLNVNYGREWINRDDREVDKNKEDKFGLAADYTPSNSMLVRLSYLNARRRMDEFDNADLEPAPLSRYDVSDRNRNMGDLMVSLNPGKLNLSMSGGLGHDKYLSPGGDLTVGNTNYYNEIQGLYDTRIAKAGLDLAYELSDKVGLVTYYEYQQDKSRQRGDEKTSGSSSTGEGRFEQLINTRYDMGGLAVNFIAVKELVDIRLGYDISSSKTNYAFTSVTAISAAQPPEDTKITEQNFSIKGNIRATPVLTFGLAYWYEKYDITDWATDTVSHIPDPTGAQRNVFLGDYTSDYKAHVIQVSANYKF